MPVFVTAVETLYCATGVRSSSSAVFLELTNVEMFQGRNDVPDRVISDLWWVDVAFSDPNE